MSTGDIDRIRERIRNPDESEVDPEAVAEDRENLLEASTIMRRHRTGKRGWSDTRHYSVLQRLITLSWGGTKYDHDEMPDASLTDALSDKEAAGEIVDWIHDTYTNEETNRDMRNALRTFGKVLTNEDPTDKDASPPPSIDWIPATTSDTYDPAPNPANMVSWEEVKKMCNHSDTNPRDAALIAIAWDAEPRSGELQDLKVRDIHDQDLGKSIRIRDGKTGTRDVTITNAVPYLRKWINQHPATNENGVPVDPDAPLWSQLKSPKDISYRLFRDAFRNAAKRVGLDKPDDPTNFRKSSASHLASKGVSQSHLEKRYGWERGSDAAARYIRVFGEDADRELAEARGMDVEMEETEPTGPKKCKRCRVLINRDAERCDNCGFYQDKETAQEQITTDARGTNVERIIEETVRDTVTEMMGPLADAENGPDDLGPDPNLRATALMLANDDFPDPSGADGEATSDEVAQERAAELRKKLGIED